jgi:phytoene dehydrogenase-like protein
MMGLSEIAGSLSKPCSPAEVSGTVATRVRTSALATVAEELSGSDSIEWKEIIDKEVESAIVSCVHQVREPAVLPEGKQALFRRVVVDFKWDWRDKTQLLAQDHRQREGPTFEDTVTPCCSYRR